MKAKIQMAHQVITGYQVNFYRAKRQNICKSNEKKKCFSWSWESLAIFGPKLFFPVFLCWNNLNYSSFQFKIM